ncbi:MAG TPA: transglycosylase SLT domain-containing protein [Acidobacteriaceae bacterium]|nr:transglycosylase SLT domain-containing protein [Acidobacteriaceae bacterium]
MQELNRLQRWMAMLGCVPLVLLAGCPQQTGTSAKIPGGANAPIIVTAKAPTPAEMAQTEAEDRAAKDQQLIARAEGTYRSGVENYRSGHLEAARADFDAAVDLLLSSGADVKSDAQLSDEFELLVDKINTLEMSALKEGTGFSAPVEAAPLDAADEVTFPPADAALTAKVTEEIKTTQSDFPLVVNDYVAGFINYFANSKKGHATLLHSLERAGKYKDMIQRDLKDAGLPQDLIYLAVAESGFQPQAVNAQSGAGGMWQFMPFASAYGLTRNGWVDERFDPEKSSLAYARYMKTLYAQFGDWYLAMAAYNWGPGNVQRSVMRTGYADFWELYKRNALPTATKNYVPGIIAAIIVAKNPKQYGLDDLAPEPAVVSDTVSVDYPIDLRLAADLSNTSLPEIVSLNPSLLHMTTPRDADFDLHLPVGTRDIFLERVKRIPEEKRTSWRFHVVRAGESLDTVASSFHDRAADIAVANGLDASGSVEPGDELMIPETAAAAAPHAAHYVTRAGDTLVTIADRFNVSVEDLRRWNHLTSSAIRPHRTLEVAQPLRLAPALSAHARRLRGTGTAAKGAHAKASAKTSVAGAKTASHGAAKKTSAASKRKTRSK